jgi:hypothetical protein
MAQRSSLAGRPTGLRGAAQLSGELPDNLNRRETVAELVEQLSGFPGRAIGVVKRIEQIADDLLSHDGGGVTAAGRRRT